MSHLFEDFQGHVDGRLQDAEARLKTTVRDQLIRQAIEQRYSKDEPEEIVADIAGNGTADLDLPSTYEDGFSVVRSVEYPVGDVPATLLEDDQWTLYRAPGGLKLRLVSARPTATENVRLTLTARHNGDGSTVKDSDFEAVVDYAAGLCFDALAASMVQVGDPTLGADVVNYRSKSSEYLRLAKELKGRYFTHMGIEPGEQGKAAVAPALAIGDVDFDLAGTDRLTHPGRSR